MLSTGAAGAIDIDAQVRRIDLDIEVIIDLR
jgi:hypothetical protein